MTMFNRLKHITGRSKATLLLSFVVLIILCFGVIIFVLFEQHSLGICSVWVSV